MRVTSSLVVAAVCGVALAQDDTTDRVEFSGLESPCDESAATQEALCETMDATNEDLEAQIASLESRVGAQLLTYGDTTNSCESTFCSIGGGQDNTVDAESSFSFIRGGKANWCYQSSPYSTILGGQSNVATGDYCTIAGGIKNKCYSNYGTIAGGYMNMASGRFATVTGGSRNTASGRYTLVAGYMASASGDYSATFGLTADGCVNTEANSVKVCSDSFVINGDDYTSVLARRRLQEEEDNEEDTMKGPCKTSDEFQQDEERLSTIAAIVDALTLLKVSP